MVTALDKKLLRDLARLKGQVITIALVVACGIAAFSGMRSTWTSLATSRATFYERYRFADAFAQLVRAPESVAGRVLTIPGVATVQTRISEGILLPMPDVISPATGLVVSLPRPGEARLNQLYLRAGRWVEPGRPGEVLINEAFAEAHGLVPGETIPAVMSGTYRDLHIAGIALSPEHIFAVPPGDITPDDKRYAILWMDRDVLAAVFRMEGAFNDIALLLQPSADQAEVLRAIDSVLAPYGIQGAAYSRDKQLSNYALSSELDQLRNMATVIPVIFLAVAAFLLNVVLARLVYLQRQQIATLKAVGYSNREVGLHYLKLVAVVVMLGAFLGILVGSWIGRSMTELYTDFFRFPILLYRLDPDVVATAILISLGAALLGALITVRQVAKLPPAEAMQPPAPARYRPSVLDKLGLHRLFGPAALMVLREIRRRPARTLLSALGIAAAIGILIVGRFSLDSFSYLFEELYHREHREDMTVTFRKPLPARVLHTIETMPGVLDAEGMRTLLARFRVGHRYRDSALFGIADRSELRRLLDGGKRELDPPASGIILTRKLGEVLGIGVGGRVTVEVRDGEHRVTRDLVVSDLIDEPMGMQGYMRLSSVDALLGQSPQISGVLLKVDPRHDVELQKRLTELPMVAGVSKKQAMIDRFHEQTGQWMGVMTAILTIFASTIAIGVVYNNARVALSMRSRDLASLRVLGFTRGEISAILLGELAVQVLLAIPIGLWLGTAWAHSVAGSIDPEAYRLPVIIAPATYAFAIVVALVSGIVSALLVRRQLDHLDLIAVLKIRE